MTVLPRLSPAGPPEPRDARRGLIRVERRLIGLNIESFALFAVFVPVTSMTVHRDGRELVEYGGYSAFFDPVPDGAPLPLYDVRFSGGKVAFARAAAPSADGLTLSLSVP
ncbi:MAG TPA: hypothetical protein VGE72_30195 [Azospirillum sp.]